MNPHSQNRSLRLIYLTDNPKPQFILDIETIQHIKSYTSTYNSSTSKQKPSESPYDNSLSFISICGDYRSGKSFLMNSLFFSNEGFKVSPTTQPCTKGINVWSKPITHNGKIVWILDTEGFGATDRDTSYDVKIFLLTTLISSLMLYNSFGALDENSINKFGAICKKAQQLDKALDNIELFWILRDFSLSIENKEGSILTADEYLEQALDANLTNSKQQRTIIKKVFKNRHCIPLVRPVIDESTLSELSQIKFEQLRGQFVEEVYKLRKNILSSIKPKSIQGLKIQSQNLENAFRSYVEILNPNSTIDFNIESSWENILAFEKEKQIENAKTKVREFFKRKTNSMPLKHNEVLRLKEQLSELVEGSLKKVLQCHFSDESIINECHSEVSRSTTKSLQVFIEQNSKLIKGVEIRYAQEEMQKVVQMVEKQGALSEIVLLEEIERAKNYCFEQTESFYPSGSQYIGKKFYEEFYNTQKVLIPKIFNNFSEKRKQKQSLENGEKYQKLQFESKKLREENMKLIHFVQDNQKQIKLLKVKLQNSEETALKYEKDKKEAQLKIQEEFNEERKSYENDIEQLKATILNLEEQFLKLKNQTQIQREDYQQKLCFRDEKIKVLQKKLQTQQKGWEESISATQTQCESRVKKAQQKYQDLLNQFQAERKKFTQLNQSKKQQESQLLEDLAEKNQKLLQLRRQIVSMGHMYRQQMDNVLKDQKRAITNELTIQLQESQHKCIIYEQKMQQYLIRIKELQVYEKDHETLLIENRLAKDEHEILVEKYSDLMNKLKKSNEHDQERQAVFEDLKLRYERDLQQKEEVMKQLKVQIKELRSDHQQEVQKLHLDHQSKLNDVQQKLKNSLSTESQEKTAILTKEFEKEIHRFNEQLSQKSKENAELKEILVKHQNISNVTKSMLARIHKQCQVYQAEASVILKKAYKELTQRNQSESAIIAEENSSIENEDSHIQQDNSILHIPLSDLERQIQTSQSQVIQMISDQKDLLKERQEIKASFKETVDQLEKCQEHISQLNKQLSNKNDQIAQIKKKLEKSTNSKSQIHSLVHKLQQIERQNQMFKKEISIRDEMYNKREKSIKENVELYKETIGNITTENNHLTDRCKKLELQVNRFSDWESDFVSGGGTYQHFTEDGHPIKTFDDEILNLNNPSADYLSKLQHYERDNKRLRKQLNQEKQFKLFSSSTHGHQKMISKVLQESNLNEMSESLKKQNALYRKRVEQLRDRQLKLIQQLKQSKLSLQMANEQKLAVVREQFEHYRKRTKDEINLLEDKIDVLTQDKYKLKQEVLRLKKVEATGGSNSNHSQEVESSTKQYERQIESLRKSMEELKSQIKSTRDECDKRIATAQITHQSKIQQLTEERTAISTQNQKNLKKYEQLLKVNSELLKQIESIKEKSINQVSLKQKYKNRISSLFQDE